MSTTPGASRHSSLSSPCPQAPAELSDAIEEAAESQAALGRVTRERDQAWTDDALHRHLASRYEGRLADALADRARLREELHAFGAYLRECGVPPEHIVPCVRSVLESAAMLAALKDRRQLEAEIVTWTIEGYYGD